MLQAVGVEASLLDPTADLIATVTPQPASHRAQRGGCRGRRDTRRHGTALAAAAGVLLTATGTAGALAYAAWAGLDRLWTLRPAARRRSVPALPQPHAAPEPRPVIGATP